jgi:hypothetical protein
MELNMNNPYLITKPKEIEEITEFLAKIEAEIADLEDDDDDFPQVLETIIREMQDDDDGCRQNRKFLDWYIESDWRDRAAIDRVLAYICGWTLPTLLHMTRGEVETEVERVVDGKSSYHSIWTLPDNPHKLALDAAYEAAKDMLPKGGYDPDFDNTAYRAARQAAQHIFDLAITAAAATKETC